MIDTDKYEGHTPAPWIADGDDERGWVVITPKHDDPYAFIERRNDDGEVVSLSEADARLIADALLLAEEVKRLRDFIQSVWDGLGEAGRNEHYELFKEYMGEVE